MDGPTVARLMLVVALEIAVLWGDLPIRPVAIVLLAIMALGLRRKDGGLE